MDSDPYDPRDVFRHIHKYISTFLMGMKCTRDDLLNVSVVASGKSAHFLIANTLKSKKVRKYTWNINYMHYFYQYLFTFQQNIF